MKFLLYVCGHRDFFINPITNLKREVKLMSEASIAKKAEAVKNVNAMLTEAQSLLTTVV